MARIEPVGMTVKDACRYLSISPASLYRLIKRGELRPYKVGGRTIIRRIDADGLLGLGSERASSGTAPLLLFG